MPAKTGENPWSGPRRRAGVGDLAELKSDRNATARTVQQSGIPNEGRCDSGHYRLRRGRDGDSRHFTKREPRGNDDDWSSME